MIYLTTSSDQIKIQKIYISLKNIFWVWSTEEQHQVQFKIKQEKIRMTCVLSPLSLIFERFPEDWFNGYEPCLTNIIRNIGELLIHSIMMMDWISYEYSYDT